MASSFVHNRVKEMHTVPLPHVNDLDCVCVCVYVPITFTPDVRFVDVPAEVTQDEGHLKFLENLTWVLTSFFIALTAAVPKPRRSRSRILTI